jgi:hypothetical protein
MPRIETTRRRLGTSLDTSGPRSAVSPTLRRVVRVTRAFHTRGHATSAPPRFGRGRRAR